MNLRELLKKLSQEEKQSLAERCHTTVGYLRKLCYFQCMPSADMASRLVKADSRLTYAEIIERPKK